MAVLLTPCDVMQTWTESCSTVMLQEWYWNPVTISHVKPREDMKLLSIKGNVFCHFSYLGFTYFLKCFVVFLLFLSIDYWISCFFLWQPDLVPELVGEATVELPLHICFSVGDLVWTKVSGYPWWPCMVTTDPEFNNHFKQKQKGLQLSVYHFTSAKRCTKKDGQSLFIEVTPES